MDSIVAVLCSAGFASVLVVILQRIFNKIDGHDTQKRAVLFILRCQISQLAKEYINEGKISQEELREITDAYATYKLLGGNGYIENIMSKINALPIDND